MCMYLYISFQFSKLRLKKGYKKTGINSGVFGICAVKRFIDHSLD